MPKQRKKSTERRQRPISRRRFLEDVVVIASGTGVGLAAMSGSGRSLSAVSASKAHEGFKVLTLDQGELLATVLNRLVPSQGKMPGAGDLGVAQFVDDVLVEAPHLRRPILDVLEGVRAAESGPVSDSQMDSVLTSIERQQKQSFDVLLQVTYTGYYSLPEVRKTIGWTESGGHADALDIRLLDEVRQRGPIFRDV